MDEQVVRRQLGEALGTVRPLVTMSREGLVLTALEWGVERPAAYGTATAAARDGALELREQAVGTVPSIEAVTKEKPVVLFAGDTVVGGKQNRIINVTVWLAAMKVTSIPVSCLEHGRWNQGYDFRASRKVDYLLRAKMSAQLADVAVREYDLAAVTPGGARVAHRSYAADQGAVWREIADKEERAHARSKTSALHDLYAREATDSAAFVRAFPCPAGRCAMPGHLLDIIEDLLDPTTAEGVTFIAGSGFLDDDDGEDDADGPPCDCWCGCRRATNWPDDTCPGCQADRHRDDR